MNTKQDITNKFTFAIECYSGTRDCDFEEVWFTSVNKTEAINEAYEYLNSEPYKMVKLLEYVGLRTIAIFYC